MNKEYRFQYIPSYIIRNWKDGDGNIPYVTRGSNDVFTSPLEDTFIEPLRVNVSPEKLREADATANTRLVDIVSAISHGDFSSLDKGIFWFSALMTHLFYVNPFGRPRMQDIAALHAEELVRNWSGAELSRILTKHFTDYRTTADILRMRELASTAFVYGFDLDSVVLEAAGTVDFVLGSNPSFFFNPSGNERFQDAQSEIAQNGIAVFLSLSPRYALCLYDGSSYKVRKREGRVILSEEDTLNFNKIMATCGTSCVFSPTEKYGDEYYAHIYDDIGDKFWEESCPEFSFFRILADVYSRYFAERKFAGRMLEYDSYIFDQKDDKSLDDYKERIRYALELASEIKGLK